MITVLCVGGTGETNSDDTRTQVTGMLANLIRMLPPERFRGEWVTYPGAYAYPVTYAESVQTGARNLTRALSSAQGRVIVVGYSQGCDVVKRALNEVLQRNAYLADKIVGVGLVADPTRPRNERTGWPAADSAAWPTYGIAGETWIGGSSAATLPGGVQVESRPLTFPVWTIVAPTDPITDLPPGNALRTIFDLTEFAGRDPIVWGEALIERAKKRQWQRWWDLANWRTWGGVIGYLRGYVWDGRHTDDYIRGGHLQRLATLITTVK